MLSVLPKGSKFGQLYFINYFFPIWKGKTWISSLILTVDFLDTYKQFNVPQWIKKGI
jgi:hypothetical protein